MSDIEKLAELLLQMTYGDLTDVARNLCQAMGDRVNEADGDINDPDEWASLLHGWAEANAPGEAS